MDDKKADIALFSMKLLMEKRKRVSFGNPFSIFLDYVKAF